LAESGIAAFGDQNVEADIHPGHSIMAAFDPTQEMDSHEQSMRCVRSRAESQLEAISQVDHTTGGTPAIKLGKKYLDTRSGRIWLAAITSNDDAYIRDFTVANVAPGSPLLTDGHASYTQLIGYAHDPRVVRIMGAHIVLSWIHRVFSLLKRWPSAPTTGFAASTSTPTSTNSSSATIGVSIATSPSRCSSAHGEPTDYWKIVGRPNPRKGRKIRRLKPRQRRSPDGLRQDPPAKPKQIAGPSTRNPVGVDADDIPF
jgi:hypothetical protein